MRDLIEYENKNDPLSFMNSNSPSKLHKKIKTDQKNFINIFKIILPNYSLSDLDSLYNYEPIHSSSDKSFMVYRNKVNQFKYKMELTVNLSVEKVLKILQNV